MPHARWLVDSLRCPDTGLGYHETADGLVRADGSVLAQIASIPSFADPATLSGLDLQMHLRYQWLAPYYDVGERVLGRLLTGVDTTRGRADIVGRCGYAPGMRLLEVSPGPGVYLAPLRAALGSDAPIAALDLSLSMLLQYRRNPAAAAVELVHGDAQSLPFADASFDALFHFGGVNLFNDPARALAQFVRVVRPGGRVAWGDERMSASFRHPIGRRVLPMINPGFRRQPPPVPAGLTDVVWHEVYGGLGYLVVANRAESGG